MKKQDIQGNYDLKVDLKNTVPYRYFFKKIGDKVYRFSKMGNEDWREDLMPFKQEPFVYWVEGQHTTNIKEKEQDD